MRKRRAFISISMVAFFLISLSFVSFYGCKKSAEEQKDEQATPQVTPEKGENVITLGKAAQEKGGIAVSKLRPTSSVKEIQAYGTVLQLQSLADLRKNYIEARARMQDTATKLAVSKKEYERLKTLNEDHKNVSDKAVQSAEAALQSDEVDADASREILSALEDASLQQYGKVITQWLFDGSPALYRLMRQEDLLIRVTLLPGTEISRIPEDVTIQPPAGKPISARFVSRSPRTDPQIQGTSFFYITPANNSLLPGMNVITSMPLGIKSKGYLVPASSIVWWQGRPWVYLRKNKERFVRREVSTENSVEDGYFVAKGFKPGELIVVKGAQTLLSREFQSQIQGEKD
jgi:multidrug efflux system membrane fusion protein